MDPNSQIPQNPQNAPPPAGGGSDWQKQAVQAARAGAQAAGKPAPPPSDIPDWQRSFQKTGSEPPADESVPDMLAPADQQQAAETPRPMVPGGPPAMSQNAVPQTPAPSYPTEGSAGGKPFVSGPFGEDVRAVAVTGRGGMTSKRKLMAVSLILVVLLALSAGLYFVFLSGKGKSVSDAAKESQQADLTNSTDMSILSSVVFVAPKDMKGYTKDDASSSSSFLSYKSTDNVCSLGFGTIAPNSLPGATVEEVVDNQIKAVRDLGASVDGPSVGDALILKDVDGKFAYKMPTLLYTVSKDSKSGKVAYSIVILKDKTLAVVNSQCLSQDNDPQSSRLSTQNRKAKEITVRTHP